MQAVRDLARQENRQISQVVNDLLLESLVRRKSVSRPAVSLPSFRMGKPKVNLGDRDALEAVMES